MGVCVCACVIYPTDPCKENSASEHFKRRYPSQIHSTTSTLHSNYAKLFVNNSHLLL